ncbi:MAG: hypothetical protein ACRC22_02645, partial [Shewanella sp.]
MMKKLNQFVLSCVASAVALTCTTTFAAEPQEDGMNVGGSVRVNYGYRDYDDKSKDKGGDFNFDVATLKVTGQKGDFGLAAEYRFTAKTNFIKFGYGYYKIDPDWE